MSVELGAINVCVLVREPGRRRVRVMAWLHRFDWLALEHARALRDRWDAVWIDDRRSPGVTITDRRELDFKPTPGIRYGRLGGRLYTYED